MLRAAVLAALALAPAVARADTDYFAHGQEANAVKVRTPGHRTPRQWAVVYGLLGGAALALGVGAYYHVDSYHAANEVSATHDLVEGIWTDERQATYDRAGASGTKAIVAYSVSGACLIGSLVASWLTRPAEHVTALTPGATTVAVVPGGAVVARAWSF